MKWPWQPREVRQSGTSYAQLVSQLIQSQADGTVVQANETAAVEAVAGALSRAFAGATVESEEWVKQAVTPRFLGQVGRDVVRTGESLHVIKVGRMGGVSLTPCSTWYWQGGTDPADWIVTATSYGPSQSETWRVPISATVFLAWGSAVARPWHGIPAAGFASLAGRLAAETERSLADESGGPTAMLLPVPSDGGDDSDDDPLSALKADISAAKGKALLVETVASAWGEGKGAAPMADWKMQRLGADPPASLVALAKDGHARTLAACGASPALWDDSDGTAKREALRQFFMGTVKPLARLLEHQLGERFHTPVKIVFDAYAADLAGRAGAFQKLVASGLSTDKAAAISGLLIDAE